MDRGDPAHFLLIFKNEVLPRLERDNGGAGAGALLEVFFGFGGPMGRWRRRRSRGLVFKLAAQRADFLAAIKTITRELFDLPVLLAEFFNQMRHLNIQRLFFESRFGRQSVFPGFEGAEHLTRDFLLLPVGYQQQHGPQRGNAAGQDRKADQPPLVLFPQHVPFFLRHRRNQAGNGPLDLELGCRVFVLARFQSGGRFIPNLIQPVDCRNRFGEAHRVGVRLTQKHANLGQVVNQSGFVTDQQGNRRRNLWDSGLADNVVDHHVSGQTQEKQSGKQGFVHIRLRNVK